MITKIPLLCWLGLHKLVRRTHPTNWRDCRRCGHIMIGRARP